MGRWEAAASRELTARPADVWALWEDPDRWSDWNPAIAEASLHGPFAIGTTAVIHFHGRPRMKFAVTTLERDRVFVDETKLPGARMGHEHRLEPAGPDSVTVTHRIYFDGPLAGLWSRLMGTRIRRDLESFLDHEQRLTAATS